MGDDFDWTPFDAHKAAVRLGCWVTLAVVCLSLWTSCGFIAAYMLVAR